MISDQFGRQFKTLRVSLTQKCNFSCEYCVPEKRSDSGCSDALDPEELLKQIYWIHKITDLKKVRLTGGEPFLYKFIDVILEGVKKLKIEDVSITTNASLLKKKISLIKQHNIKRMNVSVDSIKPEIFSQITRGGKLKAVLEGIDAALDLGVQLKLNMVPMRTINGEEILEVLDYCLDRNIECRYIELMKMGHMKQKFASEFVSQEEILSAIRKKYPIEQAFAPKESTARRYHIPGKGYFGMIANESSPFCQGCNRLRMTSEGKIYGCLSSSKSFDLKKLLPLSEEVALVEMSRILTNALATKQDSSFTGTSTLMKHVGG